MNKNGGGYCGIDDVVVVLILSSGGGASTTIYLFLPPKVDANEVPGVCLVLSRPPGVLLQEVIALQTIDRLFLFFPSFFFVPAKTRLGSQRAAEINVRSDKYLGAPNSPRGVARIPLETIVVAISLAV